jgi:hypothetical protein
MTMALKPSPTSPLAALEKGPDPEMGLDEEQEVPGGVKEELVWAEAEEEEPPARAEEHVTGQELDGSQVAAMPCRPCLLQEASKRLVILSTAERSASP